jgi:hypothetical protein
VQAFTAVWKPVEDIDIGDAVQSRGHEKCGAIWYGRKVEETKI